MKQLISFKSLIKISLFFTFCIYVLSACTDVPKLTNQDSMNSSNKLEELVQWNNVSTINIGKAESLLRNESMYIKINKNDSVFANDKTLKKLHVYASYTNNSLGYYIINADKDIVGSKTLMNDLYYYDVNVLDTNKFKASWNSKNIYNSGDSSNIGADTAWSRVAYWNTENKKNSWISQKYSHNSKNDTISVLNPMFAVFEVNVSDLAEMQDHFCFLAIGVNSENYSGPLNTINADLIITNYNISNSNGVSELLYNVEDLVHTIPPCKKIQNQCHVPKYGVLQRIIEKRMH